MKTKKCKICGEEGVVRCSLCNSFICEECWTTLQIKILSDEYEITRVGYCIKFEKRWLK